MKKKKEKKKIKYNIKKCSIDPLKVAETFLKMNKQTGRNFLLETIPRH